MKRLLILGRGQYGLLVKEIAEAVGSFSKIDFLDDRSELAVGKISELESFAGSYECAFVAIGNSEVRKSLTLRLLPHFEVVSLVHPQSFVSSSAVLGCGCVVEPMATVQSGVRLGDGVIVSSGAVIRHNSTVGSYCHVDCNSVVMTEAYVPEGTKVIALSTYVKDV